MQSKGARAAIHEDAVKVQVFGCQMNKLDGELIRSILSGGGYRFTEDTEEAGILLFVTCAVREHAEERVHSRLGALKPWKRRGGGRRVLGVLGCMAQKDGDALLSRHPHVDLVAGTRDFPRLLELLREVRSGRRVAAVDRRERPEVPRDESLRPDRARAFLSIMRGCDRYCAYCVVPYVRGSETSRPMESVLEEAERLTADGVREITLLGQTVNHYRDAEGRELADLIEGLQDLPGLARLQFVTSYPSFMDDRLIAAMASCSKVSRYLHLPAQSGSDRVLRAMNRAYTSAEYLDKVSKLRGAMPDLEMGSDFIVGYPGEEEEDFQATVRLMEAVRFQQAFVFKYSPRPGTRAAQSLRDDVPEAVKKERNARLLKVQEGISREKNARCEGKEVEVLVEGVSPRDPERLTGRTRHNQIVVFAGDPAAAGRLVAVRVLRSTPLTLIGEVAGGGEHG